MSTPSISTRNLSCDTEHDGTNEGQIEKHAGGPTSKFYGLRDPAIREDVKGTFTVSSYCASRMSSLNNEDAHCSCMQR